MGGAVVYTKKSQMKRPVSCLKKQDLEFSKRDYSTVITDLTTNLKEEAWNLLFLIVGSKNQ